MGIIIRPKDAKYGEFPPLDDFNEDEELVKQIPLDNKEGL